MAIPVLRFPIGISPRNLHRQALIAGAWQVKTRWMGESANSGLAGDLAAEWVGALDWWRDAGVDHDWTDAPHSWLAPPPPVSAESPPAVAKASPEPDEAAIIRPDAASWPASLEQFPDWWRSDLWLDPSPAESRVVPRGPAGAALMVLVGEPEREDREQLLSGPQGRLLDAMLAATGTRPDAVYRASLLPRPMPHADWSALAARGLGELALHHIALAAPHRLIVFGSHILPLLGHDPAKSPATFTQINHGSGIIPMLAVRDLAVLLERPRWKAGLWQAWLDWTADEA